MTRKYQTAGNDKKSNVVCTGVDDDMYTRILLMAQEDERTVASILMLCLKHYMPVLERGVVLKREANPSVLPPAPKRK
jgi:hypothetical protein